MIYRKCRICGCSLDPGEGNMCEECRDEQYMKQQQEKAVRYMVLSVLMKTQTGKDFEFNEKLVSIVSVIRIDCDYYTAKHRPVPVNPIV